MKNPMFSFRKGNQVSFLISLAFVLGSFTVSGQNVSPVFARVFMLKVEDGKQQEFEKFMKETIKPLHELRREKGTIVQWILFKIHFTGMNDEYNYAAVHYYPSWEKTEANEQMHEMVSQLYPDVPLGAIASKARELRTMVRQLLLRQVEAIEPEAGVATKYIRVDFMKAKPGKVADYLKAEREDWMPFHRSLVDSGKGSGWGLWQVVFPGGSASTYDYATSNRYTTYGQLSGIDYQGTFKKVHPTKNPAEIEARTVASRDLVRSELWEVVDILQ